PAAAPRVAGSGIYICSSFTAGAPRLGARPPGDRRRPDPPNGTRQRRGGASRPVGGAPHLRPNGARCVLCPRLRGGAGPALPDGDLAPRRRGPPRRSTRPTVFRPRSTSAAL